MMDIIDQYYDLEPVLQGVVLVALIIVNAMIYLLPWMVAWIRNTENKGGVAVINIFLGFTILGWIIALALAFGGRRNKL